MTHNKCCDDRKEHNISEAKDNGFPLLCKGQFSMNEEKFFDMLIQRVPNEYQLAYFFDVYQDEIEQQATDNGINEAEARQDCEC